MHYFVIALAYLCFAAIAPFRITVLTTAALILIPSIVRFTAKALAGVEPSFADAFKAVALSLFFVVLSAFMLGSAMGGIQASGIFVFVLLGGFFAAYVLGFKVSLGTSFGASAAIATVSTVSSVALLWMFKTAA